MTALFEHSPWIEARADAAPSSGDRHAGLMAVVHAATDDERLALIRAHPELAEKVRLTDASAAEQASAGLDRLSPEEFERFHTLNAAYRARFAMPFIICVRRTDKAGILAAMEARLANDRDTEIATAIEEIGEIVRLRLAATYHPSPSGEGQGWGLSASDGREAGLRSPAGSPAERPHPNPASGRSGSQPDLNRAGRGSPDAPEGEGLDEADRPYTGLAALESRVAHDLACLNIPSPDWTRPRPGVFDVVIVGGGQSGLGAAFGLLRERVSNILVIDENPAGAEGPWDTYARMRTLRTPKFLTGIDLGVASLTFRAWWEAQHGASGWATLDKIARPDWMAYLRWYRRILDLPVRNGVALTLIEPQGDGTHRLHLSDGTTLRARKVVLATGIQGGGQWHVPRFVSDALPTTRYAHTSKAIDYTALAGKRIAILGGGASAFDNATAALEAGVAQVHVYIRRAELPRVNPIRFMERVGFTPRYPSLDDATKYDVMASFFVRNQPPTTDMFERAAGYPGFALHTGSPWSALADTVEGVHVTTPKGAATYDFLVLSTGLVTDPALRPELAAVADGIARWRDRYTPPASIANSTIDAHPYLGPAFEFTGKTPQDDARLHGLFAFNYSALITHGLSASALSGLAHALPRLVTGIADQLFLDDRHDIVAEYHAFAEEEFSSVWPQLAEAAE